VKTANGHPRFYELLEAMADTYSAKSNDYSGDVPMKDIKEVSEIGIEPWVGVVVRLVHKFGRLKTLTKGRKAMCKDETIIDTLMDIACYSLITIILLEEKEN